MLTEKWGKQSSNEPSQKRADSANARLISAMNGSRIALPSVLAILSCLGLSSCATTPREPPPPSPTQKALVGKTQQELMSCVGIQPEVKTVEGVTQLKYYKEASQFEESFAGTKSSMARVHHGCWVTLRLANDVVTEVRYRSVPNDYLDYDHCDEIFENCLGK